MWNVGGIDYAIAIHGQRILDGQRTDQITGTLNLRQEVECNNANDDSCGNVQWHSVFPLPGTGVIKSGDTVTQTVTYDIGTVSEIQSLGYSSHPDRPHTRLFL